MSETKDFYFAAGASIETPPVPVELRRNAGYILRQVQEGKDPDPTKCSNFKAYSTVGSGCYQISLDKTWRIIYWVGPKAIYVLNVFPKKRNNTPKQAIETCKTRLVAVKKHHRCNYE